MYYKQKNMSIDHIFSRELKRLERMPERALYKQTRKFTRNSEKKLMAQLENKKKQKRSQKIAKEILWFFASLFIAVIGAFILFYAIGEIFPQTFIQLIILVKSTIVLYMIFLAICFVGVYFARIISWALKTIGK